MTDLRDYINLEHRGDMTVLNCGGAEYMVADVKFQYDDWQHYDRYSYTPRAHISFMVYPLPARPAPQKKRRSWAEAYGLRKP